MDRTPRRTDTTTHRGAVPGLMSTLPSVSTASSRAAATDDHTSVLVCPPCRRGGALNDTAIGPSVRVFVCPTTTASKMVPNRFRPYGWHALNNWCY